MTQVIRETVKYMWRSEKNRLFMALTTALVLIYSLFLVPKISGDVEVDIEMMEREMTGNVIQFEEALDEGLIVPNVLTGTTAYDQWRRESVAQRELLTALKQGDAKRYIEIDYRPTTATEREASGLEQLVFNVFGYELEQPYQTVKNKVYQDEVEPLSFHIVHDRTSLQQIHLFLIGLGPVLLLLGLVFLISDVHVKDRSLQTQKIGIPMSWQKYSFTQALTAFCFVSLFYLFLFGVFFLVNGLLYGFGSFALPIGHYDPNFELGFLNQENYQVETLGRFLLQALPYLLLLGYLFTRLNTLLSLWTKQSVVTMVLGMFLILFQTLYYGRDSAELAEVDLSIFPQTYIDFGKVLTGRLEQQQLVAIPNLYTKGLLVLGATILITEGFIYGSSKKMTRQKFMS
ncbi:hypothetical protein SAMN02745249_00689 [Atopostipes suicloacalis DSM 15692]|uniref:ABC-2 type transport system permease protein n=1 Tax=Atopostipes suicloacalis DSM 15692 TaxID=1121025 RepID=A0A1M4UI54_9LACT|nr:hypothetical protein [Atopostipes suicloacalis]SHE56387.1 hypothetical protein SAMN02745249_00689 [Atopostipes suicloacalis DSM 15692]